MPPCFRLPEERQSLAIHLWRRFAFFPGGAFRFPDGHQEFGLLARQFAPSGLPAAFPDFGEIFADFARQRDSFGRHWINVTGLRSISTRGFWEVRYLFWSAISLVSCPPIGLTLSWLVLMWNVAVGRTAARNSAGSMAV